tara:strand:+ start:204 stop:359 length:156 start_codon:yes stop_codon:yes gene_type:complete
MIEVVLVVICVIGLYASWSMIKYNKEIKKRKNDNQKRASKYHESREDELNE